LLKLAGMPDTDLQRLLRHYDIDQVHLVSSLTRSLERFKTGNARTPALSPQLVRLISDAWMLASPDFGAPRIRSGHLLLALRENDELARLAREASGEFEKIAVADLHQNLPTLVAGSGEDRDSGMPEDRNSGMPAVARIFISYRREDSSGWAGRLYDRLSQRFGGDNVFMDIDTIDPGLDFVEVIQQAVGSCDVLVALIGRHWLTSTDEQGQRRLENPEDFVRLEITAALERNIRVIPALLQGAPDAASGGAAGRPEAAGAPQCTCGQRDPLSR
jgi:hypothetical protein